MLMNVSSLSEQELIDSLRHGDLRIRTGAFVVQVMSRIRTVADGIRLLYADYPLISERDAFADFHVSLDRPAGLRRWIRPQVLFRSDGNTTFKPLPLDQAFPMLEWGMNWCVSSYAHRYLMIHAAVIEKNGRVAILPAPPGSGKSTLCAALIHRGWRLLSDEMTLIRISDGRVVPVPRPVSLKNQSIDIIKRYAPEAVFSRVVSDTVKGKVAHMKADRAHIQRADETALPGWIVFPQYQAGAATQLTALPRAQAFMRVAENAFNYNLLGREGFDTLAQLVGASGCYEFRYSVLDEAIECFAGLQPVPDYP